MRKRTESFLVRLTKEEKSLFEAHVEDETTTEDSLSGLMRIGARQVINDDDTNDASIDEEQLTRVVNDAMSDVNERLERLEDALADIDGEISVEEEVDDLATDIASELPVLNSPDEFDDMLKVAKSAEKASTLEFAKIDSTAESWADYVDEDINKTRRALSRAYEWFPDVHYVEDEEFENRRYYRVEEESS